MNLAYRIYKDILHTPFIFDSYSAGIKNHHYGYYHPDTDPPGVPDGSRDANAQGCRQPKDYHVTEHEAYTKIYRDRLESTGLRGSLVGPGTSSYFIADLR